MLGSVEPTLNSPIPKNIVQGMQIPGRREALLREFDAHVLKKSWMIIVDFPGNDKPIMLMHMLQSDKYDELGEVARNKARMVADGRKQDEYGYDIETYAPNLQKESVRLLSVLLFSSILTCRQQMCVKHFYAPH